MLDISPSGHLDRYKYNVVINITNVEYLFLLFLYLSFKSCKLILYLNMSKCNRYWCKKYDFKLRYKGQNSDHLIFLTQYSLSLKQLWILSFHLCYLKSNLFINEAREKILWRKQCCCNSCVVMAMKLLSIFIHV